MVDKLAAIPPSLKLVGTHSKSRCFKLLKAGAYLPSAGWKPITKNGNLVVWVIYGITFGWLARIKIHHRNSLWSMLWNGMSHNRFVVRCSGGILLHGLIFIWTKFKSSLNHYHWSLGYSCSHNHGSGKWVPPIWVFPKIGVSQNGW